MFSSSSSGTELLLVVESYGLLNDICGVTGLPSGASPVGG